MFDIGWSEMAIIALLALIIIGPKDLPRVSRTVGQWVRKGRLLAREFQNSLDDMVKDTELEDVKKEIEKVGRTDVRRTIEKTIDPEGDLANALEIKDGVDSAMNAFPDKPVGKPKPAPVKAVTNGHDEVTTPSVTSTKAAATADKPAAAGKTASATKPKPAVKAKAAATARKPTAKTKTRKPAAAKNTASATAGSTTSGTSTTKPKRSTTQSGASKKLSGDQADGGEPTTVAAKSS